MRFAHWLPTIFLFACSLLSAQQVMRVVSSVPLPDAWNRIDYARPSCGPKGDFIARQMADPTELPHELVHIDAKGALLGQIELHQIGGFENGTIDDAALDSRGEIVLLVRKVRSSRPTRVDDEGRPRGMSFSMELASWVLTVDDSARLLSKFSFDQRIVAGLQFALFHSGNVLVPGRISQHGEPAEFGAAIFSPAGGVLAIKRLPFEDGMYAGAQLRPVPGDGEEVYVTHLGTGPYVFKVSADGTVGPKVMLAVPEDERATVLKIAGNRALAWISGAKSPPAGMIGRASNWQPEAVFDTESGTLVDTLLVPQGEEGPICYSDSGITFVRSHPHAMLDVLGPNPVPH